MATTATVHAGNLGRWFEELCRLKHRHLRALVDPGGAPRLIRNAFPDSGGVYAFWWTGSRRWLQGPARRRVIELAGPSGRAVRITVDDEWLGLSTGLPVPLYVGKTAERLQRRIGQHLRLRDRRTIDPVIGRRKQRAPTTSCQLRAGIDLLFPHVRDTRDLVLDNIGLSFVVLDGSSHAANRFYLEDLAIGLMRPPVNVDVER